MNNIRLRILDLGEMTFPKKELICTSDAEAMIVSPALAVLIEHPTAGYILYDTGNDPAWERTYNTAMKRTYPITRLVSITEALACLDLSPIDIDVLALSHMHFDHVGGLCQFNNTAAGKHVVVSELELAAAREESEKDDSAYISALFRNPSGITFHTVLGTYPLAPGVFLFPQKCHTAGLMGLRVELASGTVLFTSDSVYTQESDFLALPPGGAINRSTEEFHQNLMMLRDMQACYSGRLFYGHDIQQARTWQKLGWIE